MVITSSAAHLPTPSSFPPYTSTTFYKSLQASYIISRLDIIFTDSKNQVSNSQLKPISTLPTIKSKSKNIGLGVRDAKIHKHRTKIPKSVFEAKSLMKRAKPNTLPLQNRSATSFNSCRHQRNFASRATTTTSFQYPLEKSSKADSKTKLSDAEISFNAIMAKSSTSKMKLQYTIQGHKIVIFVDSGSTIGYLSEALVSDSQPLAFRVVGICSYVIFLSRLPKPPDILLRMARLEDKANFEGGGIDRVPR